MNSIDPDRRGAARLAAFIALPLAVIAGVVTFWSLGGFDHGKTPAPAASGRPQATTAVSISPPALAPAAVGTCRQVVANLPGSLRELGRRPVTGGTEQSAAYGDPPIVLTCGEKPVTIEPTATVYGLSGVCWYARQTPDGSEWTTVDRVVPVRVRVPGSYDQPGQWVIEFAKAISENDQHLDSAPTGCG